MSETTPVYSNPLISYIASHRPEYRFSAHHHLIADALLKVESGETKRLMILMPPRHSKSTMVSEFFPAWYLKRNPNKDIFGLFYNQGIANFFRQRVKDQLSDNLKEDYHAIGVGSELTGRYGSFIVDDVIKSREECGEDLFREIKNWFLCVLAPHLRFDGFVVFCATRWEANDLAGWLMDHSDEWTVLKLPAINDKGEALWPERFPIEVLNRIKNTLPLSEWMALYQQSPMDERQTIHTAAQNSDTDQLWRKITDYLRAGAGDPSSRCLLEETLMVLSQREK